MAIIPVPCATCGSGTGGPGQPQSEAEQLLLCDVLPDGTIAGTALMVTIYDNTGTAIGPPTAVDPVTGDPYVAQGILQPCPGDIGCAPPSQFCFTTTATGPVEHPGRIYDIDLPINPGFAVDSLQIDATSYPANLTWAVTDADGAQFAAALQSFLAARFPDQTVTVTNPNAGTPVCGQALPMEVHIECARIDGTVPAPDLVELIYNGGRDLVVNPAYLTTPPTDLNGPQFVYLRRQDAGGTLNCTNVANQGWETNDLGDGTRDFELWGQGPGGLQTTSGTTPTPRGTPVQEITADINDTGAGPTIWQTFTVPAAGTLKAVLVHGARDNGEQHRITLSTGDTNDNQVGDIINNVTNPPQVTNAGGGTPGPWTTFSQDVALGAGTYTFAISTTNPVGANRGGLFTDMRVYVDSPDQHAAADVDDDTCTVTTEETVTTTTCEFWQPRCSNGDITDWVNVADGEELSNAEFWAQVPAPTCCTATGGGGGGGSVAAGNLTHSYLICGTLNGVTRPMSRVVITDQSGGVIAATIVDTNGAPVTPASWQPGACPDSVDFEHLLLCDTVSVGPNLGETTTTRFLRRYTSAGFTDTTLDGATPYVPAGFVGACDSLDTETLIVCDFGNLDVDGNPYQFIQEWAYSPANGQPFTLSSRNFDGTGYASVGPIGSCGAAGAGSVAEFVMCDAVAIPTGPPVERITNGNFVADAAGWTIAGNANWTNNPGYAGPDAAVGVLALNGGGLPANAVVTQTVNTGITPGDVFHLQARLGTKSTDSGSTGPIRVLVEVLDGGSNVLYSQQYVPTMLVGGVAIQWPANGVVNVPGIVATDSAITVRFTDQSGPANLVGADGAIDAVSLVQQASAGTESTPFIRKLIQDQNGAVLSVVDLTLDGDPYVVEGTVGTCPVELGTITVATEQQDVESFILCDSAAPTPNRLILSIRYDAESGAYIGQETRNLAGAIVAPVGALQVCPTTVATDIDFDQIELCDSNGGFIRRFTFNSGTGAVIAVTNLTLAGAAYVPVGTVSVCDSCCPITVGEGCYNAGSGRYTALRLPTGVISLIDSVTGAAVLAADIIPCPAENTADALVRTGLRHASGATTINVKALQPGVQSMTLTVLTGFVTASMQDGFGQPIPAGVSLTWSVNDTDDSSLSFGQFTGDVDSDFIVHWTYKDTSAG